MSVLTNRERHLTTSQRRALSRLAIKAGYPRRFKKGKQKGAVCIDEAGKPEPIGDQTLASLRRSGLVQWNKWWLNITPKGRDALK